LSIVAVSARTTILSKMLPAESRWEKRLHSTLSCPPEAVTVTIPARLHLGFLDPAGQQGRRFGGIGLAVSGSQTRVVIRRAERTIVDGPERERVLRHLGAMRTRLGIRDAHHLTIGEMVPAHAGLGSGTQLALAVAAGLRRLHDLPIEIEADAAALGRGARSGLGVGLFRSGGVVVDGGRGPLTGVPPIISRLPFPEEWRVVLTLDPSRHGVHGSAEAAAFAALPTFPVEDAAENCRLILMQALPALAERDLPAFGAAISELQSRIGDYFAPIQGGGRFTSPDVAAAMSMLRAEGAHGIGQSSWGPTGFAFAPDAATADRLARRLRSEGRFAGLDIRICQGLNRGAHIGAGAAVTTSMA
jgi:beta-RFAP synthase